jgi:hypothetical protein
VSYKVWYIDTYDYPSEPWGVCRSKPPCDPNDKCPMAIAMGLRPEHSAVVAFALKDRT